MSFPEKLITNLAVCAWS